MAKNSQALALPDNVFGLLAEADKRKGFPPGTMQSLLMQETGGKPQYLTDPTTYHYAANAEGKRIAPHTGKISTAFGPLGILESTAKDPGFGVKPLGDRKDIAEHIRFAADYAGARGIAKYGEGAGYEAQVIRRRDKNKAPATAQIATAPVVQAAPVVLAQDAPAQEVPVEQVVAQAPAPVPAGDPNAWNNFITTMRAVQAQPVEQPPPAAAPVNYLGVQAPNFMAALSGMSQQDPRLAFQSFGGWSARG